MPISNHMPPKSTKYISTEDATKIIEFYKSPAGQRMIEAQPYMMTEMQLGVQVAQQTAKDVMARHKDEIEAAQRVHGPATAAKPRSALRQALLQIRRVRQNRKAQLIRQGRLRSSRGAIS